MSFSFNPFIDNLDFKNEGGGGGGDVTINGFLGSSFTFTGQTAGSAPAVTVNTTSGANTIESRAWQTQYVVDPSTTVGLRGTYTTIQAALDAATADGMTFNNRKVIYIRPGSYTENLALNAGAILTAASKPIGSGINPVVVLGSHTIAALGVFSANNIVFQNNGSLSNDLFAGAASAGIVMFKDCILNNALGALITIASSLTLLCEDCIFAGTPDSPYSFVLPSVTSAYFNRCEFSNLSSNVNGSSYNFNYCTNIGNVNFSDSGYAKFNCCTFYTDNLSCITRTTPIGGGSDFGTVCNCLFGSNAGPYCIDDPTGNWIVTNSQILPGNSPNMTFLSPTTNLEFTKETLGNILIGVRSATDYASGTPPGTGGNQGYIGITDTSAPRSVMISHTCVDYEVIVADESGNASMNAITITDGVGGLISGNASLALNTDFAVARLHAIPGGDWIIISLQQ